MVYGRQYRIALVALTGILASSQLVGLDFVLGARIFSFVLPPIILL